MVEKNIFHIDGYLCPNSGYGNCQENWFGLSLAFLTVYSWIMLHMNFYQEIMRTTPFNHLSPFTLHLEESVLEECLNVLNWVTCPTPCVLFKYRCSLK